MYYEEGKEAFAQGKAHNDNPYSLYSFKWEDWRDGWMDAWMSNRMWEADNA